jgi:hypothetical protein
MRKIVLGMVDSYGDAEQIVEQLEREGIVGNEVQVISDPDDEVLGFGDEAAKPRPEGFAEKIRHFFGSLSHSGRNQDAFHPDDPEIYASHVRQGRAVIMVSSPDEAEADRAAEVLRLSGAYDPRGDKGPRILWEDDRPEINPSGASGEKRGAAATSGITGGTKADLEARGTEIRKPA